MESLVDVCVCFPVDVCVRQMAYQWVWWNISTDLSDQGIDNRAYHKIVKFEMLWTYRTVRWNSTFLRLFRLKSQSAPTLLLSLLWILLWSRAPTPSAPLAALLPSRVFINHRKSADYVSLLASSDMTGPRKCGPPRTLVGAFSLHFPVTVSNAIIVSLWSLPGLPICKVRRSIHRSYIRRGWRWKQSRCPTLLQYVQ